MRVVLLELLYVLITLYESILSSVVPLKVLFSWICW